jgi:hypothetical protein
LAPQDNDGRRDDLRPVSALRIEGVATATVADARTSSHNPRPRSYGTEKPGIDDVATIYRRKVMTSKKRTKQPAKGRGKVKDLEVKNAKQVKGGVENVSLNFAKVSVEYQPQK